jgi:hypothetical protein
VALGFVGEIGEVGMDIKTKLKIKAKIFFLGLLEP